MSELSFVDGVVLTLADLERHDPHSRTGSDEQRFLCPLDACRDYTDRARHRSLTANVYSGLWWCHRCGNGGMLREFWQDRPRPAPRRPQRVTQPATPTATPRPAVVSKQRVGAVRRWACQDATGTVRGVQCRQDLQVTRADGSTAPDKQPWWELPDGSPSKGQIHGTELVYCATPLPDIPDGADVLIVEGPPKADAGQRLGCRYVVALVCGAASTPVDALLDQLARWRCTLAPDNDDAGRGVMRRVAAGLLERGAAPRWLTLPVGDKGDLVDYERDGGMAEDLAARLAATPAAYTEVVAALRAELGDEGDCAALEAENAELRASLRAADAELADLKRQQPQALVRRLVDQLAPLEAQKQTRGMGIQLVTMLAERAANVEAGKAADTPIPWDGAVRTQQFGRDANTLRKPLDLLEEYKFIDRDYEYLGQPGSGDHRRRVQVTFTDDVPLDIPDALNAMRRKIAQGPPLRERPKRSHGCAPCRTARCPAHPTAPVQHRVQIHCTVCNGLAAPDHVHEPQAPSREAPPAVMHLRTAVVDFLARPTVDDSTENFSPTSIPHTPSTENFSRTPASGDVLDAALDTVERLAQDLQLDTLPPLKAQTLKLKVYQQVVQVLRAGQPAPTAADLADRCLDCGQPLAPTEMVVHEHCPAAEVA